ncbi:hypothetical protein [Pseudoalteromonas sp. OF7H-1]|uniref:hypothetical protein n=1 Tax=Pseudoalteromonas sp. OF7H-1 TaxID=2917755 RepID=UPI001EF5788D|nr:hypothetical protein [Pseudoalteromonas sp. OF7H-1]MCG7540600.1 hypothetical protein [Pseudoalteromonas sp. OF7H-1]
MAHDNKKVVLKGQAAIELWLQGREAWNKWVEENPVADVSFHKADFTKYGVVPFENYKFPKGSVDFSQAQFGAGDVDFTQAQFGDGGVYFRETQFGEGDVYFIMAQFGNGYVDFAKAQFGEGDVYFGEAQFGNSDVNFAQAQLGEGDVNFAHAQFGEGEVYFGHARFGSGEVSFKNVDFGDGDVIFSKVIFGNGPIYFNESKFGAGHVYFNSAQFGENNVYFYQVQFGGQYTSFAKAQFEGNVYFNASIVSGMFAFSDIRNVHKARTVSFKYTTFESAVNLGGNRFSCVPDFTNTKLSHQLSLSHFTVNPRKRNSDRFVINFIIALQRFCFGHKLKHSRVKKALELSNKFPWVGKITAVDKKDIDRIRRLKELAETNKHHKLALDLHIEEMKCSRWIETTSKRALFAEFLFEKFGDYGRSIQRPLVGIAATGVLCSPIYYFNSTVKEPLFTDALYYSFSQMLHLIPSSRTGRSELAIKLFESTDKIPNHIFLLSWAQSLISIALVFLVGLALRNRFRV